MASHGDDWGEAAWTVFLRRVLPRVLSSPQSTHEAVQGHSAPANAPPVADPSAAAAISSFVLRAGDAFSGLCDRLPVVSQAVHGELLGQLSSTCLQWLVQVCILSFILQSAFS